MNKWKTFTIGIIDFNVEQIIYLYEAIHQNSFNANDNGFISWAPKHPSILAPMSDRTKKVEISKRNYECNS